MWVPFVISLQGLETALDLLHVGQRGGSLSSALLLTDGVPNVEPPGGHMEALERYKAAKGEAKPRGIVGWLSHGSCDLVPHGWSQYVGVNPKIGGKTPKWMVKIMENPIKLDDLGVPLFLETPMS